MERLKNIKFIHFIGIGGISMSGLAKICKHFGMEVSGSDITYQNSIDDLRKNGIIVYIGHNSTNIKHAELVVYSGAIPENNCELRYALKKNIRRIERSQFLNVLSNSFKQSIAISGTHGKTTTTAMLASILEMAKLDPCVHIGGIIPKWNNNIKLGKSNIFLTEACEFKKSFLSLSPSFSAITNIEAEHMDCYKTTKNLYQSFNQFVNQTTKKCFINDKYIHLLNNKSNKIISWGQNSNSTYTLKNIKQINGIYSADFLYENESLFNAKLKIIGKYNLYNALCATSIAHHLQIKNEIIKTCLENFENVQRRFEFVCNLQNAKVYKDYAHHPTEIKNCLFACKKIGGFKEVICVFQPHTYSRTKLLFKDFLNSFENADKLILLPTYSARELEIKGGKSEDLFYELKKLRKNVFFATDFDECRTLLRPFTEDNNLILLMGAGNIDNLYKSTSTIKKDL